MRLAHVGWFRCLFVALLAVCLIALVSCGGGSDEKAATDSPGSSSSSSATGTSSPTGTAVPQGPVGLIAIGHSALTGESSDPNRPGQPAEENSWATGTAPDVNSIYQRLVAVRSETEGHVANLAKGGALAATLASQAQSALAIVPAPALVIIQTIDNDIRCDGHDDARLEDFGTKVGNALHVITETSPGSKILIVSQPGRPARGAVSLATIPDAKDNFQGEGMCDFFSPAGDLVEEHVATLTAIIESYEAEQARVCATVPQCSTDNGAFAGAEVDDISNFVQGDWNHFTVHGLSLLAEAMWPTVAALLNLPQ